ncbi:Hint domain-containing protein [Commensalibacter papalotli (ex Servin-Garciduenas et al. 2014)]|uniref:Outer membrane protein n=1 Tax=Commensalibacter papalotli (ex Servin-Garciduenas et al. 2014) TaxID=1208583 RepID=W7DZF1_9PROT|nr:Hint domain-containing protein [Commensalibacter papalotli (ex Servin-Garciduenas et al. 2014)]EUK19428.1 outer membrane protein [Commensalibacter papalotli (ex Servin-Garciduenas et al. 2014)]
MVDLVVSSGQILQNSNITSQTVSISDGGSAYYNTVLNRGAVIINDGSSEFLYISSGTVTVNNTGVAKNNYIYSKGLLNINSGGLVNNNYISAGGNLTVNSSGSANNNYIYNSGNLNVYGGSINNTHISMGGTVKVSSGALAENNFIYGFSGYTTNTSADLIIYNGGSADHNYISGGGSLSVTNGGFANNNYIYSSGTLNIYSGGSVGVTSVGENGSITLNSNANWSTDNFSLITLDSKAKFIVQSGAVLHDMVLSNQGSFVIGAGGAASNITIDGGVLFNNSATVFQNITFGSKGGTLGFDGNYSLTQNLLSDYKFNSNAILELTNGATLSGAILSAGTLKIGTDGSSFKNIINGGSLIINYSSSWNNGGKPNLYGTIFGSNGGTLILQQGVWDGGEISQLNGLNSNVHLFLVNGEETYKGGGLNNTNITSQYVTASGGNTSVYNTSINTGAHFDLYYGRASNVTINSGGNFNLYNSAYADDIILNNGSMNVIYTKDRENGAYISNITINSGAVLNTTSANIENMIFNNGIVNIIAGYLRSAQINSTNTFYASNTILRRVEINSNAVLHLLNIKNAQHNDSEFITINNGGTLDVINADNAINPLIMSTTINSGGIFNISNYNYNVTPIVYNTFISNGGVFNANNTYISDTTILSGGILNVNSGLTVSTIVNSGATLNISNDGSAYMTFVSSGANINVVSGGVIDQTTIIENGNLSIGYHGVLLNATINSNASVVIGEGGKLSGVVTLKQGGYIYINTSAGGIIDLLNSASIPTMRSYQDLISTNDMARIVISGTGSATTVISGFTGNNPEDSNTIVLDGVTQNDVTGVTYPDNDHVIFNLKDGSTVTLNVAGIGNYGYELGSDANGNVVFEVCFLAGTMIETPDGFCAVENITIGDLVMTYDYRTKTKNPRPVTWVGHKKKIVEKKSTYDESEYPVRILKGALAENIPNKDLLLTPEHCLFFDGKFIPVRMLVNDNSIFYDTSFTQYDYYHIETENHSVIIADGVLTESYLDTGNRHIFNHDQNVIDTSFNHPKSWEDDAAALLTVTRDVVEPIYQNIFNRISKDQLNTKTTIMTKDPDLYLITDKGKVITQKTSQINNKLTFTLPADTQGVWIMSRTSRPCDVIGSFIDDRRYLGVLVGDITLQRNGKTYDITTHTKTDCLSGWDVKENIPCRWTNGKAFLPLNIKKHCSIHTRLTLTIVSDHSYIIESVNNNRKIA